MPLSAPVDQVIAAAAAEHHLAGREVKLRDLSLAGAVKPIPHTSKVWDVRVRVIDFRWKIVEQRRTIRSAPGSVLPIAFPGDWPSDLSK
jgi:hypothetical protein